MGLFMENKYFDESFLKNIECIQNDIYSFLLSYALIFSLEVQLFDLLEEKPLSIADLQKKLGLSEKNLKVLLPILTAYSYLEINKSENIVKYSCSKKASSILCKKSPRNYLKNLRISKSTINMLSYDCFLQKFKSETSSELKNPEKDYFSSILTDKKEMMELLNTIDDHGSYLAPLCFNNVDLSKNKVFLDIGAGSAKYALSCQKANPNIKTILFDLPSQIEIISEKYISDLKNTDKTLLFSGDFWKDDFPEADVHFYSNVIHDWDKEKVLFLLKKSFASLPHKDGKIVISTMLIDEESPKKSPSLMSADILNYTEGRNYFKNELLYMLNNIGFNNISMIDLNYSGYYVVIGYK